MGFEPIANWPSCFWHPEHRLFLVIYVDDFKLAGPRDKLELGWDLIKAALKMLQRRVQYEDQLEAFVSSLLDFAA